MCPVSDLTGTRTRSNATSSSEQPDRVARTGRISLICLTCFARPVAKRREKIACAPRVSVLDRSLPLKPFGGAAPQRVAVLGPEEAEMAEFRGTDVRRRDGEDLRFDRREARAQQLDRRSSRPGIVRETDRAQSAPVFWKVRETGKRLVVEEIARAVHPAHPLQERVPRQVFAESAPARRVAEQTGQGGADKVEHGENAVTLR